MRKKVLQPVREGRSLLSYLAQSKYTVLFVRNGVCDVCDTPCTMIAFMICLERLRGSFCTEHISQVQEVFPHNLTSIFPAVDASTLDIRSDPRVSPFARYHIAHSLDTDFVHTAKASAVGCSLSHIALWQKAVELDEPIVVLEDDVRMDKAFMHTAISRIPPDVDHAAIVYLPFADRSECDEYWCKVQPRMGFGGTQMYYITPRGANILLEQALPIVSQIDVYIGYVANTRDDFRSVFYKMEHFTSYEFWSEFGQSTIGHDIEIKKFLPESNAFYALSTVVFISCVFGTIRAVQLSIHKRKKSKA